MTFWAKLLTILVFILSLIFATASALVFGTHENYRASLNKLSGEFEAFKGEAKQQIAALEKQNQELHDENTRANSERDSARTIAEDLRGQIVRAEGQVKEKQKSIEQQDMRIAQLVQSNTGLIARNKEYVDAHDKIKTENEDLYGKLRTQSKQIGDLELERTNLQGEVEGLKVDMAEARRTIKESDAIMVALEESGYEPKAIIHDLRTVPDIKARVMAVDDTDDTVVINVGSQQGVKKGYEFIVYRGGKFVAKVRVFHFEATESAAEVVVRERDIRPGDQAATWLP